VLIDYCIFAVVESTLKEKGPHITPNKAQFICSMIADHQEDYEVSQVWYAINYILLFVCVENGTRQKERIPTFCWTAAKTMSSVYRIKTVFTNKRIILLFKEHAEAGIY